MTTEPNCVFCKIVAKQIPAAIVYEDADFLAFLSVNPDVVGHTLIIPKAHYRWVWDVPQAGAYFEVARKIALAQQKAFNTKFILSKTVGEEVPHAHIHVFPTRDAKGEKKDFEGNQKKIVDAM